ncbi:MAG: dienelactone hydrolase family protein [Pseudomonadota bacterium]
MPTLTIPAHDGGSFDAYVAMPEGANETSKHPVVIVVQEIFGVNEGLRGKCDWLASQGFVAICPDLFWRIEPGIELSDQVPAELERAFELFGLFDIERGIEDLRATNHVAKGHANSNGSVGVLGYCLGGKLAYLMGCRSDVKASVGYYGVGIEELLNEANSLSGELMLHIAEKDGFVPSEAQVKIVDSLSPKDNVILHTYPDMDHAFTREGGDNYDAGNAEMADGHTIAFLKQHLA